MNKVIMTGFCQVGSISPAVAIHSFGYHCHGYDEVAYHAARDGDYGPMLSLVERYDCLRDWPFSLYCDVIAERYPDAVFMHVERANPDLWFNNMLPYTNHKTGLDYAFIFRDWFGRSRLRPQDRQLAVDVYEEHNAYVRKSLGDRLKLVFCIDNHHRWHEIGKVLGVELCDTLRGPEHDHVLMPFPDPTTRMAWVYNTQTRYAIYGLDQPMWDHNMLIGEADDS